MEPRNRLSQIFGKIGLTKPRPTDAQLADWGMSIKRFTQLYDNRGNMPITVSEERLLRVWLRDNFSGSHIYLFEDELPTAQLVGKQERLQLH